MIVDIDLDKRNGHIIRLWTDILLFAERAAISLRTAEVGVWLQNLHVSRQDNSWHYVAKHLFAMC